MQAIARPDGRDMSVSDAPFHWDAQLDIRKLRVGIIQDSFDSLSNADAKRNAQEVLDVLKRLGVPAPVAVNVPVFNTNVAALGIESAAYFDHMTREGKLAGARGGTRKSAWLTPAVEYIQQQRVRMLMMMQLEEATRGLDVYVVAANNTGGTPGTGGRGRGAPGDPQPIRPRRPKRDAAVRGAGAAAGRRRRVAERHPAPLHDGESGGVSGDQCARTASPRTASRQTSRSTRGRSATRRCSRLPRRIRTSRASICGSRQSWAEFSISIQHSELPASAPSADPHE